MKILHFHFLQDDDDPVLRNQSMALLPLSGPLYSVVFWKIKSHCGRLPVIMGFLMRRYDAFFWN